MTIRSFLSSRKPWIMIPLVLCGLLAGAGIGLGRINGWGGLLGSLGGVCFIVAAAYAYLLAFLCPKCGNSLASLALQKGWLYIDHRIRYCPYCGTDVDAELSEALSEATETNRKEM